VVHILGIIYICGCAQDGSPKVIGGISGWPVIWLLWAAKYLYCNEINATLWSFRPHAWNWKEFYKDKQRYLVIIASILVARMNSDTLPNKQRPVVERGSTRAGCCPLICSLATSLDTGRRQLIKPWHMCMATCMTAESGGRRGTSFGSTLTLHQYMAPHTLTPITRWQHSNTPTSSSNIALTCPDVRPKARCAQSIAGRSRLFINKIP
jgi:hypothetical protein